MDTAIDWQDITKSLTKSYGADITQDAIVQMLVLLGDGKEIKDVRSYAAAICRSLVRQASEQVKTLSLDQILDEVHVGRTPPDSLLDSSYSSEYQTIVAETEQARIKVQKEYFSRLDPARGSLYYYWRAKYAKALKTLED